MTDYVIIEPDGELGEFEGYPANEVGCHGYSGQNLFQTRRYVDGLPFMLRMVGCDCSLVMPGEHPPNPVGQAVVGVLGYPHRIRGRIAIYRIDWQNEPVALTPGDLSGLRNMAAAARATQKRRDNPPPVDATVGVYEVSLGDDGQIHVDPVVEAVLADPGETPVIVGADEHFIGCHPDDSEAPENDRPLSEIPDTEPCWHCGTLATRGVCGDECDDCWGNADYVPPSAVSHCMTCGRWWAYMTGPNVITITFEPQQ